MPRPTSKVELVNLSDSNLIRLLSFIEELPKEWKEKEYQNEELNDRDKTIADIICHLHEWHNMMMSWYKIGMSEQKPAIPAEDVTWKTLPILNHRIYEKYKGTKLEEGLKMLNNSHEEVKKLILNHTEEELFEKKRYDWTGTTSLGAYLISATSSHYDWALKTIRPIKKFIQ